MKTITLVRGLTYGYKNMLFQAGVPVQVNDDVADYLKETAVDSVVDNGELVLFPKFTYEDPNTVDAEEVDLADDEEASIGEDGEVVIEKKGKKGKEGKQLKKAVVEDAIDDDLDLDEDI